MILFQIFVCLFVGVLYYYQTKYGQTRRAFSGDYLNCDHGKLNIQHSPKCSCENNWDGIACDMCKEKDSCSGKQICDTSLLVGEHKKYECSLTSETLRDVAGDILKMDCDETTCRLTSWGKQPSLINPSYEEYHKVFECMVYNISRNSSHYNYDTKKLTTVSSQSSCHCFDDSKYCRGDDGDFLKPMLKQMTGSSILVCNLLTKKCELDHKDYPGVIFMKCAGAGCLDQELPYPNEYIEDYVEIKLSWQGYVVDVLAAFLLVSIVMACCLCCSINCVHCCKGCLEREYRSLSKTPIFIEFVIAGYKVGRKRILRDMRQDGKYLLKPGVTAFLGPSGAGKTTIMNIIAGQDMQGDTILSRCVGGGTHRDTQIFYNSHRIQTVPVRRLIGFVEQDNVMTPYHSIRREINFSSGLRSGQSRKERKKEIDELMNLMNLNEDEYKRIGSSLNRGLSGGERKRVAVIRELGSGSSVIFMDEPTSGLDEGNRKAVLETIHKMAKEKKITILLSIHTPTNELFDFFDEILYVDEGSIVLHARTIDFIENAKSANRKTLNNFLIESSEPNVSEDVQFSINEEEEEGGEDFVEIDIKSSTSNPRPKVANILSEFKEVQYDKFLKENATGLSRILARPQKPSIFDDVEVHGKHAVQEVEREFVYSNNPNQRSAVYPKQDTLKHWVGMDRNNAFDIRKIGALQSSPFRQFRYLFTREFHEALSQWLPILYNIFFVVLVSVIVGALYYDQENGVAGSQNRMGFLFFFCLYLGLTSMPSLSIFSDDSKIQYWREYKTGYYSKSIYFLVRMLANFIKFRLLPPIIFSFTSYQMIGLHGGVISTHFVWFLFIIMVITILTDLVCIIVGVLAPKKSTVVIYTCILLFNVLTSGLILNISSIPQWVKWLGYFGFWKLAYEALMINEFVGLIVTIDPKGFPAYEATGEFWLGELEMYKEKFDFDFTMLLIYIVIYIVVALFCFVAFVRVRK